MSIYRWLAIYTVLASLLPPSFTPHFLKLPMAISHCWPFSAALITLKHGSKRLVFHEHQWFVTWSFNLDAYSPHMLHHCQRFREIAPLMFRIGHGTAPWAEMSGTTSAWGMRQKTCHARRQLPQALKGKVLTPHNPSLSKPIPKPIMTK